MTIEELCAEYRKESKRLGQWLKDHPSAGMSPDQIRERNHVTTMFREVNSIAAYLGKYQENRLDTNLGRYSQIIAARIKE